MKPKTKRKSVRRPRDLHLESTSKYCPHCKGGLRVDNYLSAVDCSVSDLRKTSIWVDRMIKFLEQERKR